MPAQLDLTPRQQTLLVFIGEAEPGELDPVRIMKGLFLIAMEAPRPWLAVDGRYSFEPYNYGPFSSLVYSDLESLEAQGYIASEVVRGQSWKYYSLTQTGKKLAAELSATMPAGLTRYIEKVRKFVTRLSFSRLLTAVYRRYPDYAMNSVFGDREKAGA